MRAGSYIVSRRSGDEPKGCCDGGSAPDDCCNPVGGFGEYSLSPSLVLGAGLIAYGVYALFFAKKR